MGEGRTQQVFRGRKGQTVPPAFSNPRLVSTRHAFQVSRAVSKDLGVEELVFEPAFKPQSALRETMVHGQRCFTGWVRFVSPNQKRQLLNPFVKFVDEGGNQFRVSGLRDALVTVFSAKLEEKVPVTCIQRGEKTFDVVRWGIPKAVSCFEGKPSLCDCGEEVEFCTCSFKRNRQSRLAREPVLA